MFYPADKIKAIHNGKGTPLEKAQKVVDALQIALIVCENGAKKNDAIVLMYAEQATKIRKDLARFEGAIEQAKAKNKG